MSDKHQHRIVRRNALKAIVAGLTVAVNFKALALTDENKNEVKDKMNTNVIVNFKVKMEKVAEFTKILDSVKTDLPKVKGCISVNIFKNTSTANKFTLVETWETKELHQTHIDKLAKNGAWDVIALHLSKDPESGYFTQL